VTRLLLGTAVVAAASATAPPSSVAQAPRRPTVDDAAGSPDDDDDTNATESAHADAGTETAAPERPRKRPAPDLDGRPPADPSPGEKLLVVPRTLLFPVHLLFEYALRRPLGLLLTEMERNGLGAIFDFLLFDDQRAGIVPVVLVDFDFQPSGGLHYFHNELGSPRNAIQLWASTGGRQWWRVTVQDRLYLDAGEKRRLRFTFDAWRRPDYLFHGLGAASQVRDLSRYQRTFANGTVAFRLGLWRSSSLEWQVTAGFNRFADGDFRGERTIREAVAQGRFPLPPGFASGYTAVRHTLRLTADSRRPWPAPGSGGVASVWGTQAFDAEDLDRRWVRWGALGAAFHDFGGRRVVGAALQAEQVVPTGPADVPFTELVYLGVSPVFLGGFPPGRLIGGTAMAGSLRYSYPIWPLLDASVTASVGNVFGDAWSGLAPDQLRTSFGIGVMTSDNPDQAFTFQVAVGTKTFAEGAGFDSLRLYVGVSRL